MKFSKDTSRLVEGRSYWCIGTGDQEPYVAHYRTIDASCGYLWGDECPPPTVEVERHAGAYDGWNTRVEPGLFYGMKIKVDPSLPPGSARVEGRDGSWCEIRNIGAPVTPERPAWTPPVCPAGQAYLVSESGSRIAITVCDTPLLGLRYPPPFWPPRIGEIVEVRKGDGHEWVPAMVIGAPFPSGLSVPSGHGLLHACDEGVAWRWVYRDLSDYTPPGGAP